MDQNKKSGSMAERLEGLIRSFLNYETISYLIVGVLTTIVDFAVFAVANEALSASGGLSEVTAVMTAQVISWASAVLFAYILNKLVVFKNYDLRPAHILSEAAAFVAARVLSGVIVTVAIWLMVDLMGCNEYFAKLFTSVINIVLNYVASKLFIFRKK